MRMFLIATLLIMPTFATAQDVTALTRLIARCGQGACENALNGTLRRMDLDPATNGQVQDDLASIALALFTVARDTENPRTRARVARAILNLSEATPDTVQAQVFRNAADAILNGETDLYTTENPFSASPS